MEIYHFKKLFNTLKFSLLKVRNNIKIIKNE